MNNEQVLRPWPSQTRANIEDDDAPPPPVGKKVYARAKLATATDVSRELAKLYREARSGSVKVEDASRLANILAILSRILIDSDLEARIEALEVKG